MNYTQSLCLKSWKRCKLMLIALALSLPGCGFDPMAEDDFGDMDKSSQRTLPSAPESKEEPANESPSSEPQTEKPETRQGTTPQSSAPFTIATVTSKSLTDPMQPVQPLAAFTVDWQSAKKHVNGIATFDPIGRVPYPSTDITHYRLASIEKLTRSCSHGEPVIQLRVIGEGDDERGQLRRTVALLNEGERVPVEQWQYIYNLEVLIDNSAACDSIELRIVLHYVQTQPDPEIFRTYF